MVSYTLPGMTEFPDLNLLFLSFYRDARDIFFDDVAIESVYGGFPGSPLCGGRNNLGEAISLGDVEKCLARYRNLGVACNVTFTNQLATSAAIERDAYGKRILSLLDEQSPDGDLPNGVILYTDAMDEYVRSTHPRLRRISSTTKQLPSVEATNREIGEFDRVVLNYNLTHDEQAISSIDHPEKLEVMANEYCTLGCPYRTEHYRATSESQIKGVPCAFECKHKPAPQAWGFLNGLIEGDVFLKNDQIRHYANGLGVGSFKIVGRGLSRYDVIDSYLYYLVKPEHWYEVRDYLIHRSYLERRFRCAVIRARPIAPSLSDFFGQDCGFVSNRSSFLHRQRILHLCICTINCRLPCVNDLLIRQYYAIQAPQLVHFLSKKYQFAQFTCENKLPK